MFLFIKNLACFFTFWSETGIFATSNPSVNYEEKKREIHFSGQRLSTLGGFGSYSSQNQIFRGCWKIAMAGNKPLSVNEVIHNKPF